MKKVRFVLITVFLFAISVTAFNQEVAVDLGMVYKIRQEGLRNSDIETLAYIMTDLAGPRLTGSAGLTVPTRSPGPSWQSTVSRKYALSVRVSSPAADGTIRKAYAAMTKP